MVERDFIISKQKITYEGLFDAQTLYKIIDEWFEERGYDKREALNTESVLPESKNIELLLEPWKKITDYAKIVIRLRIQMTNLKEVEIKKDGGKIKLNQGKVHLVFDGILETDYENKWEGKPMFYVIKVMFDKFFYKPFSSGYASWVKDDVAHLSQRIKSFLNLYRYT